MCFNSGGTAAEQEQTEQGLRYLRLAFTNSSLLEEEPHVVGRSGGDSSGAGRGSVPCHESVPVLVVHTYISPLDSTVE